MVLQAQSLALPGLRHGFFTRDGGVSAGVYASLNGGVGSQDAAANVAENRARMAAALGVAPDHFLTALSDPFAQRRRRRHAVDAGGAAARRRHRDAHAAASPSAFRARIAGRC